MSAVQAGEKPALDEQPSAKRDAITRAATELFLETGYGAVSMDLIAKTAGVSKATLYAYFTSKEALFSAIVEGSCREQMARFDRLNEEIDFSNVELTLGAIGREYAKLLLSPNKLRMYRLIVSESPRFPELGRIYYEGGPKVGLDRMAEYLAALAATGELNIQDPRRAADLFFSMLRGDYYLRGILGVAPLEALSDSQETGIDTAVQTFLAVFRRRNLQAGKVSPA